jgi:probable rRNA maturation factor
MIQVDIVSKSKKWKTHEEFITESFKKIIPLTDLKKILKKNINLEVSVSLVLDREMQKINYAFRGKDKPTNVLSFPAVDSISLKELSKIDYLFLGDVIIAFETVTKESLAQKKAFENHLTHLILHSVLHLIGFDHEDDEMAEIMESLEIKILKKLKIKNPYI